MVLLTLLCGRPAAADEPEARYPKRWFYASHNLLVERNVDDLIGLLQRAGNAGYNGVLLADYKFNILGRMPEKYFQNVARVREAASKAGIEIIPAVFPIGYSAGLLAHDPNLAEGLAVVDAPFIVEGGEAKLVRGPAALANGDLEEARDDRLIGFSSQDDPGKVTFVDRSIKHHGQSSVRMENRKERSSTGNSRLIQHLKVRPHACYRFSCWVKTEGLARPSNFRLLAIGAGKKGRPLTFTEGGIEPTQDWKQVNVVFNSLDHDEINVYVGLWGPSEGKLWVDELELTELSLVNVLRREGCPLNVKSEDGQTTYEEGRDLDRVVDPKLGNVPYAGEFDFSHEGPPLRLTKGSRIKPGQRLKVSWYHSVFTHGSQVMCCLSEPKVYELLDDQADRITDLLQPRTFFMSHDEIRVANWCQACQRRKLTPGELLADNAKRCVKILKDTNPRAEVVVWSDMFDPNHNAHDDYYLVNGTLAGSWKGLPSEVIIANWNSGKAAASLKFFAEAGHRQIIAGYYDDGIDNFTRWDRAARGVPKVVGFMYTTWAHKYGDLEAYGRALRGKGQ